MSLTVDEVRDGRDRRTFVNIPWRLSHYRNDPNWVPPLKLENRYRMSEHFNPFFKNARVKYFIARRNGKPVGRISAHESYNFNRFQNTKWGFFGWFESEDDPETAGELFKAAGETLKSWGLEASVGPFNFTTNDECGLLIDGFDTPPMILMTHNPPYYQKLIEGQGYEKAQDLFAYRMDASQPEPEVVSKIAEQARARPGVKFRCWDLKNNIERELEYFLEIYNASWNRNWGFVPLEREELMGHKFEFKHLLDQEVAFMAEVEGKPAGFALSLPNLNEAIVHMNGKVNPVTVMKFMRAKKKITSLRVFALGVKPEYRKIGIGAVFYVDTLLVARRRGYKWGEMSWILESNDAMNRAIRTMGGRVYKTYRIFKKDL